MKKRFMSIMLSTALLIGSLNLTGCNLSKKTSPVQKNGALTTAVKRYSKTENISASALKLAYGEEEVDSSVQPIYNVPVTSNLTYTLNFDIGDYYVGDVVTVHSDRECLEESKITCNYDWENVDGKTRITIIPQSYSTIYNEANSEAAQERTGWGNLPIYYMRVTLDVYADELVVLDEPVIIPFTVESDVSTPNIQAKVDDRSVFSLSWQEIPEAVSYNIYNLKNSFNSEAVPVDAAKKGYNADRGFASYHIELVANTTETEFIDFNSTISPDDIKDGVLKNSSGYVRRQNGYVNGEYYVTAVDAQGRESNFSIPVDAYYYKDILPVYIEDSNFEYGATYDSVDDMPLVAKVRNCYDETIERDVCYTLGDGQSFKGNSPIIYKYKIVGTALSGEVKVEFSGNKEDYPKTIGENENNTASGINDKGNDIPSVPDKDVEPVKNEPGEDDIIDQKKDETKEDIEEGNKEVVSTIEGIYINADSAEEEWIALNLINANEEIDLKAFTSLQDFEYLKDVLCKVIYQNPYIIGASPIEVDYDKKALIVEYDFSKEEIAKMQKEITQEADKVFSSIMKQGMSDKEMSDAIYKYLADNTKYDDACLESAAKNGYMYADPEYDVSFTTYAILVNKVGVCMSYAYVYKLLCDMAGVECVVVCGMTDTAGHAWNKINIDDEWYVMDSTNNYNNTGLLNFLYYVPDEIATASHTYESLDAVLDSEITEYVADDYKYDYYVNNDMIIESAEDFLDVHKKNQNSDDPNFMRFSLDYDMNQLYYDLNEMPESELAVLEDYALIDSGLYIVTFKQ